MGLDILTLLHPEYVGPIRDDEGNWLEEPPTRDGEWASSVYGGDYPEHLDGRKEGYYFGIQGHRFRAGSYSGYNYAREKICKAVLGVEPKEVWDNSEQFVGRPLVKLIDFTDCEGTVGPDTSRLLGYELAAADLNGLDTYPRDVAEDFKRAFTQAANADGFVLFR